jgi:hypothetical protein
MSDGVDQRLTDALEACRRRLKEAPFLETLGRLGAHGRPEQAFQLLSGITTDSGSADALARLCASVDPGSGQHLVERTLLILASQHAIAQIPDLAVADSVKRLFADEFHFFASPPASWVSRFRNNDVRYREMARVATLRRFPAGQFHWEVSGFPRSWMAKARHPWRVVWHVFGRMGGFAPLFELHLNARRKNRIILLERESNISYFRAARSLERQPAVRGLMLSSWLFCESTPQVTPHLAWLRRTPESAGALLVDMGPAAPDSGFLTGDEDRRKQYEAGTYRPRSVCVLWPRKSLIDWANRHSEFNISAQ